MVKFLMISVAATGTASGNTRIWIVALAEAMVCLSGTIVWDSSVLSTIEAIEASERGNKGSWELSRAEMPLVQEICNSWGFYFLLC